MTSAPKGGGGVREMMTFSDMGGGGVSPIADVSKKKRHFTAIPTNKTRKPHSLNLRNSKKMFLKTYNCNYSIYWIWIYSFTYSYVLVREGGGCIQI